MNDTGKSLDQGAASKATLDLPLGPVSPHVAAWPGPGTLLMLETERTQNFIIELWVQQSVFINEARLMRCEGPHTALLNPALIDGCSVVWRQVTLAPDLRQFLSLSWTAVANASPDADYVCRIAVRDAAGNLVSSAAGDNPLAITRRIGPRTQPLDFGEARIVLAPRAA